MVEYTLMVEPNFKTIEDVKDFRSLLEERLYEISNSLAAVGL